MSRITYNTLPADYRDVVDAVVDSWVEDGEEAAGDTFVQELYHFPNIESKYVEAIARIASERVIK